MTVGGHITFKHAMPTQPRQQRARQSRRAIPLARTPQPQPIAVRYNSSNATSVNFDITTPLDQLVVTGIPEVMALSVSQLPTGVTFAATGDPVYPTSMHLTYVGSLSSTEQFIFPPYMPQVRNSFGGFIAAGEIIIAPPTPAQFDWTATAIGGNIGRITVVSGATSVTLLPGNEIDWVGAGAQALLTRIDELTFEITFANPVSPGDTVNWNSTPGSMASQIGGVTTAGTKTAM